MAKSKTSTWFRKVRGSYLPSSPTGLLIYFIYVIYILTVAFDWYRLGHSPWVLLTTVIPVVVVAAVVVQFIASRHSK